MNIKIVHRWTGAVLYETDTADLRAATVTAVAALANLRGADLRDADLTDANLTGANLMDADLTGADLTGADLTGFRDDIWAVLSSAPAEAPAVLAALEAGTVDGSNYSGACACLVGTIANARGCNFDAIPSLTPDARRPAEVWFAQIEPNCTPETHEPTRLAAEWVSGWIDRMRAAFGPQEVTR